MNRKKQLEILKNKTQDLYLNYKNKLLFHGWHHVNFVFGKSHEFAIDLGANVFLVESSALVHDLDHLLGKDPTSKEVDLYRKELLESCGYSYSECIAIRSIVSQSHTSIRNERISKEAKALSDADTLFKILPITLIFFTKEYLIETNISLEGLALKITSEQGKLLNSGCYFYSKIAKLKYLDWAVQNIKLWEFIRDNIHDQTLVELISYIEKTYMLLE